MTLDTSILKKCSAKAEHLLQMEQNAEQAKVEYHDAIRRLYLAGGTYREISLALGLSHQKIGKIISSGTPRWLSRCFGKHPKQPRLLNCFICNQKTTMLIAGLHANICDRCVDHSLALFRDTRFTGDSNSLCLRHSEKARCSFCAIQQDGISKFAGTEEDRICKECLDLAKVVASKEKGKQSPPTQL